MICYSSVVTGSGSIRYSHILCLACIFIVVMTSVPTAAETSGGAYYNYKSWDCQIKGNELKLKVAHKVTIENARGEEYSNIVLSESNLRKLKDVSIKVFDTDGNCLYTKKKKDLLKICGFGSVALYDDDCSYAIKIEIPQYPYSIEYSYTMIAKSLFLWTDAIFQHKIPVERAIYTLTVPDKMTFHHRVYGFDITPEIEQDSDETVTYTWAMADIPPLEEIDYVPPGYNERARIAFAANHFSLEGYALEGCTWESIGYWMDDLDREKYRKLPPRFRPISGPVIDLVREDYDEVVNNIRYVSIQIGIGGWQPYAASLTEERGYGDCKDMSALLISKLRYRGITAYAARLLTRSAGLTDVDFPDIAFNHAITVAVLDDDTIWMDPTCNYCPFGELPGRDENIKALVVTDEGGQLWSTSSSSASDNNVRRTTSLNIGANRKANMVTTVEAVGNYARSLRNYLVSADKDEARQMINSMFDGAGKKFKVNSYEIENLTDPYQPLIITILAEYYKPIRKIGKTIYLDLLVYGGLYGVELTDTEDREIPLYLRYPRSLSDRVVITWDKSLGIQEITLPDNDSLSYDFGDISLQTEARGDTVFVDFNRAYHAYMIKPEWFDDFGDFCDGARDIYSGYLKLISTSKR